MSIIEICISFQVAIMGIAYPIILQVATDLDNKYNSIRITELFKQEPIQSFFRYILYLNLLLTLIYIGWNILNFYNFEVKIPSYISLGFIWLFVIMTGFLVFGFLFYVNKVIRYYSTKELIKYLGKKHDKLVKTNDYEVER